MTSTQPCNERRSVHNSQTKSPEPTKRTRPPIRESIPDPHGSHVRLLGLGFRGMYLDLFPNFLFLFGDFPLDLSLTGFIALLDFLFSFIVGTIDFIAYAFCTVEGSFTSLAGIGFCITPCCAGVAPGGIEVIATYLISISRYNCSKTRSKERMSFRRIGEGSTSCNCAEANPEE